jgi:hypothetical protein
MAFHPQYVTDESMNRVAVLIPYAEWLKITKKLGLDVGGTADVSEPMLGDGFLQSLESPSPKVEKMAAAARRSHREGKTRKFPG